MFVGPSCETQLILFNLIYCVWGLMLLYGVLLQRSSGLVARCFCEEYGVRAGLHKLHVIGWEHSKMAVRAISSPPSFIYHLDSSDDFVRIKRDLCVISWKNRRAEFDRHDKSCDVVSEHYILKQKLRLELLVYCNKVSKKLLQKLQV